MLELFFRGGIFMWPILFIAIGIAILTIKKAIDIFGRKQMEQKSLESGLNAIILWGGLSVVFGFLAHFWGLYLALMEISRANDISPAIVAGGFAVSLITILFGLIILIISAIAWGVLRWQYKKLV